MTTEDDKPTILDKAKDIATDIKEKVTEFVGENEEKIHGGIEKTGEFIDDKLTKGRFSEKIDKAQDAAKNAVTKIGSAGESDDPGDPGPPTPPTVDPDPTPQSGE
jgi:hypothetical protein